MTLHQTRLIGHIIGENYNFGRPFFVLVSSRKEIVDIHSANLFPGSLQDRLAQSELDQPLSLSASLLVLYVILYFRSPGNRIVIIIVIVNSRFLERPQKRSRRNQLIHRRLTKTKSIGSGQDPESQAGRQSDGYGGWCLELRRGGRYEEDNILDLLLS